MPIEPIATDCAAPATRLCRLAVPPATTADRSLRRTVVSSPIQAVQPPTAHRRRRKRCAPAADETVRRTAGDLDAVHR